MSAVSDAGTPFDAQTVAEPQPRHPFWTGGDVMLFLGLLLASIVACMFVAGGIAAATGVQGALKTALLVTPQFIAYGLAFIALKLMFATRYGQPFWRSLAWRFDPWSAVPMFVVGFVMAVALSSLGYWLGARPGQSPMEQLLRDSRTAILIGVLAVTVGPVAEELIFRGLIQPVLVRTLGVAAGIVLTAIPFALVHGLQYAWAWQYVLLIFAAGAMFGLIRHRTGSTATSSIVHAGYNSTFFLSLLMQRGFNI